MGTRKRDLLCHETLAKICRPVENFSIDLAVKLLLGNLGGLVRKTLSAFVNSVINSISESSRTD